MARTTFSTLMKGKGIHGMKAEGDHWRALEGGRKYPQTGTDHCTSQATAADALIRLRLAASLAPVLRSSLMAPSALAFSAQDT